MSGRNLASAMKIEPGELADVFRREAARLLRCAADMLEHDNDVAAEDFVKRARGYMERADALEFAWEHENPDDEYLESEIEIRADSNEARSGVTEATPRHHDPAVVAAPQSTPREAG